MVPMRQLSEERVLIMIQEAISKYDEKQDRRHRENSLKLDDIQDKIARAGGEKDYRQWLFPTLLSAALVVVTVLQIYHH